MNFTMLDTNPHIAPLLVRLYDRHKLYGLAQRPDDGARTELAAVMVDLLNIKLSPRETELITDVLVGLMRQAEVELRRALAERLAAMDGVPLRMVLHLANDEISVADPVLKHSPVLHDMDLIYIIKSNGAAHWRSIAQREQMSALIVNLLADTRDLDTAIHLTKNTSVSLTDHAVEIFADMARDSEKLAKPLLHRSEISPATARALYQFMGGELKSYINTHFDSAAEVVSAVDELVLELMVSEEREYFPTRQMIHTAEVLRQKRLLSVTHMMDNLRHGMIASFISQFSTFHGLPPEKIHHALREKNGKAFAHICKALDITKADFMSIFLLTYKMRSHGERIVNQADLSGALIHFDKADPRACRDLIKGWRQ